jgi:hypothetical protein
MDRPGVSVSQLDASFEYAGYVGSVFVVEFVSFRKRFGKNFVILAILFVEPHPKWRGIKDDLFVFLLVDHQNYGTI